MFTPALPELVNPLSHQRCVAALVSEKALHVSGAVLFFIAGTGCLLACIDDWQRGCRRQLHRIAEVPKKRKSCRGGQNRRKRQLNGLNAVFSTAICSSSAESPGLRKSSMTIFAQYVMLCVMVAGVFREVICLSFHRAPQTKKSPPFHACRSCEKQLNPRALRCFLNKFQCFFELNGIFR